MFLLSQLYVIQTELNAELWIISIFGRASFILSPIDVDGVGFVAGLVLMGGHVACKMMTFPEAFIANRTLKFLLSLPSMRVGAELALVMGSHVIDQVAGHAEADIAFGANILSG